MLTLILCLIWQIISFILSPNDYGCVSAWTTLGSGPAIDLQKMPILAKKKINFLHEAHFDLGGYVNKQNCRIWGTENQHTYIEKPTHPKRATVWCGFWSRGIIGTFSFKNVYRAMLKEFLYTKIEEEDIGNIWFQQDGAAATQPKLHSMFCVLFLMIALSAAELMSFGHL